MSKGPGATEGAREPAKGPGLGRAVGEVSLSLEAASAQRTEHGMLIACEAELVNLSAAAMIIKTNFSSVFDGLSLVVTSDGGEEIVRRPYILHQSPYAEPSPMELSPGRTRKRLVFPLDDFMKGIPAARVKLEGGLPGTKIEAGLASNEMRVVIDDGPGR